MIILYDITRLVARRRAITPTGIDRVDFRYAIYFSESTEYDVHYILQEGGRFFIIDKKVILLLLKLFKLKWFANNESVLVQMALDKGIGLFFSYVRKKLQIQNKENTLIEVTNYKDILNRALNLKPNKMWGGRLKWVNSIPKFIKLPLLFMSGNIYFIYKISHKIRHKKIIEDTRNSTIDSELAKLIKNNTGREIKYFNMSHHGIDNINGYTDLICLGVNKMIFCIYDLIPITFPEYVRDGDSDKHQMRINTVLNFEESEIITISNDSKDEIIKYAQNQDISNIPKINVLYIGVEEHMKEYRNIQENKFETYTPYFIYVSTIEPRKNHLLLLNIWREFTHTLREEDIPKLIIVGKRGWENQSITAMLDRCEAIDKYIIELSGLSDTELIELYKNAQALLFPSYTEGWGMPIVETLTLGTPVICNDIKVLHEAGQGLAEYINVLDSKLWSEMIIEYSDSKSILRNKQLERLKSFRPPTWNEYFQEFEDIIKHK